VEMALRIEAWRDRSPLRSTDTEGEAEPERSVDSPQATRSPWRPKALNAEDAERTERGRKGRELVESKYSWDTVAGHLLAACT